MATGAAADGLFRPIYEGSISGYDNGIERRPYHRNCGCALHSKAQKNCTHKFNNNVSYPIRRAWSEGSLVLAAAAASSSAHSSPSSNSPAYAGASRPQLCFVDREGEEEHH